MQTMQAAIFRGTERETLDLLSATENSCAPPAPCLKDAHGRVVTVCAAHRALLDQRFLDGILWVKRSIALYRAEENMEPKA